MAYTEGKPIPNREFEGFVHRIYIGRGPMLISLEGNLDPYQFIDGLDGTYVRVKVELMRKCKCGEKTFNANGVCDECKGKRV